MLELAATFLEHGHDILIEWLLVMLCLGFVFTMHLVIVSFAVLLCHRLRARFAERSSRWMRGRLWTCAPNLAREILEISGLSTPVPLMIAICLRCALRHGETEMVGRLARDILCILTVFLKCASGILHSATGYRLRWPV